MQQPSVTRNEDVVSVGFDEIENRAVRQAFPDIHEGARIQTLVSKLLGKLAGNALVQNGPNHAASTAGRK